MKKKIEFNSKYLLVILLFVLFGVIVYFTVTSYNNKIKNPSNKNKNKPVEESFEITYKENNECLTYIDNLKEINYTSLRTSDYKETLKLYNTVYEECEENCEDKKPLENYYLSCLEDVKYKFHEEELDVIDAIKENKLTISDLEKYLTDKKMSKVIIKDVIKYDTTAPELVLKDVSIEVGSPYGLKTFIVSCSDDSGEDCILAYTNAVMDEYTDVGTYTITISAKDSSNNETIRNAKLFINAKKVIPTPEPEKHTCEVVNGKYYDKDGKVVSKSEYDKSCNPTPEPEKHTCEVVNGKYYDKDGKVVSKSEYDKSCNPTPEPEEKPEEKPEETPKEPDKNTTPTA